jgi:hypothetical protein
MYLALGPGEMAVFVLEVLPADVLAEILGAVVSLALLAASRPDLLPRVVGPWARRVGRWAAGAGALRVLVLTEAVQRASVRRLE